MEHESSTGPEQIAAGLEALIGRQEVSEQYVRFRIGLLGAQRTVYHALTAARDRSKVVPIEELPFDETLARQFIEDLSGVLDTENGPNRDLTRLSEAAARDRELLARLARRAACGSDIEFFAALAEKLAADVEALLFFGRALAAPFVTEAVRRSKPRVTSPQSSNACPWCSSAPGLAMLGRDAGKRILFCSVCGESWEFSRVKCPFCGDQAGLGTLTVGTDDPCSIETCGQCKGYLKTVDVRQLPRDKEVVPLVETTATVYLDLIAEKEGYARALPYVALQ